jgi:hypothetical protein
VIDILFCSYDLLIACKEIGEGTLHVPELLGDVFIDHITTEGAYDTKLDSKRVKNGRILELLQRYTQRSAFSGNAE